ncbi:hypothetical protein NIES2135_67660 (plasmid) [Leptolyngbya boryana NIES-2135]|jgi:hypothetical protein|uniref:Small integral membrane protein n=1 Tax=Leptolyngbya boryana NIES-2135 TaxID=1973484 RepID=A0A1Z4JT19_LEPBY|nr:MULTISPECIES: hypothetical protein [Leptolyngbya]BAY59889.1 hypothetical protein NIES2135_67660 [Leptolyngbya boryana NIES-2135]MBD2369559.1 hypothetical protein [Leptolyngbya sp. FACHB-161]MBD2375996.1 hypothetical protein [Leptolyngbya sp. FACHB-238]MBD2400272.1 hypothetical protein [Leptolyngbya sp. FACHB-239]MBD2406814.1 hypothetical protein [Leptolyngbya sp. FACHB-402]
MDKLDDLESKLFNKNYSDMSERESELLLEQYKLYVGMMDKISERRHQANAFFLSVNTTLVTALAGFITLFYKDKTQNVSIAMAGVAGVIFCLTWWRLIRSYSQLNTGKFKIIHLLEEKMPARLFAAEWEALKRGDGSKYTPFTHVETYIPLIFAGFYIALVLYVLLR